MTAALKDLAAVTSAVGLVDTLEGLAGIHAPGCPAVVLRRRPVPGFQQWIDSLDPERLPSARLVLTPENVIGAVRQLFDASGISYGAERYWLEADVADLSEQFAKIMRAPYLRVRLDAVRTNACRKFHIDAITARLICTYRGSGTQYGFSSDGADPQRVFQLATGSPMILRGTQWPESPSSGLLHRSPPIEGTGETRLVLVLDPVFEREEEI